MSEYFPKPKSSGTNVKVELDLSNYTDLNATVVDTLDFAKKSISADWKSDLDKLDIHKSRNLPSGLNSLK